MFNEIKGTISETSNFFNQWYSFENDLKGLEEFWNNKKFNELPIQKSIPDILIVTGKTDNLEIKDSVIIKKSDRILISGESGSGKTTLIRGIIGHLNGIKYDNDDLPLTYVNKIAYMKQTIREDTPVVKTTIRQLFYDEIIDNKIINCLELVNLKPWFEKSMNNNLDDEIQNRISGGEKTRLCLAIVIYQLESKNCDWLILDEPEQGIDSSMMPLILKNIIDYFPDITIFLITHLCECQTKLLKINNLIEIKNGIVYSSISS